MGKVRKSHHSFHRPAETVKPHALKESQSDVPGPSLSLFYLFGR